MRRLLKEEQERHLDDVVDEMIQSAAPEIVRAIKEQEVDEDVNEFYEGAIDAVDDLESYMDYRFPHEEQYEEEPTDSELYRAGYAYGEANFDKIRRGMQDVVDSATRKEQVLQAINVFEDRITEESIIAALEEIYSFGKEQMDDIHGLISMMQKKYGWKGYAAFVGIEIFEHALLPAMLSTINPAFGIIAVIPTVEILAATGLVIYKKTKPKEEPPPHVPGHLDWYEESGLQTSGRIRRGTMRLTENQLRKLIRARILENVSQFSPEQQDLLDKEIAKLKASQSYLAQYPKAWDEKEFLQNVYFILEALATGENTAEDFKSWVGKRWPNYTVPMYQYLLDTIFPDGYKHHDRHQY